MAADPPLDLLSAGRTALSTATDAIRTALQHVGPHQGALLTGTAALELYGVRRLPRQSRIHVLVPCDSMRTSTGHVVIERTPRMPGHRSYGTEWPVPLSYGH